MPMWGWLLGGAILLITIALAAKSERRLRKAIPEEEHKPFRYEQPPQAIAQSKPARRNAVPPPKAASREPNSYRIVYTDISGNVTDRTIADHAVSVIDGKLYVKGWCFHSNDERTFRADRIGRMWDGNGRAVDNPLEAFRSEAEALGAFDRDRANNAHRRALARIRPGLSALVWIARTDREIDAAEMAILLEYGHARLSLAKTKTEQKLDEDLTRAALEEIRPIKADALKSLTDMPNGSPQANLLRDAAEKLVASSGEPDPAKANRWSQIQRAFG